jgi:hypothetical protein
VSITGRAWGRVKRDDDDDDNDGLVFVVFGNDYK